MLSINIMSRYWAAGSGECITHIRVDTTLLTEWLHPGIYTQPAQTHRRTFSRLIENLISELFPPSDPKTTIPAPNQCNLFSAWPVDSHTYILGCVDLKRHIWDMLKDLCGGGNCLEMASWPGAPRQLRHYSVSLCLRSRNQSNDWQ